MSKTGWGPALWAFAYLVALYVCAMAACVIICNLMGWC